MSTQAVLCRPQAPRAAVLVAAENDGYVAPHAVAAIHTHWHGSQLWHVPGGHVSGFITLNSMFIKAVQESLSKLDTWPQQPQRAAGQPEHATTVSSQLAARTPMAMVGRNSVGAPSKAPPPPVSSPQKRH